MSTLPSDTRRFRAAREAEWRRLEHIVATAERRSVRALSDEGLLGRWLQWVASAAPGQCPVQDDDGRHGGLRQPDDVWFLAGTFSTASSTFLPLGLS